MRREWTLEISVSRGNCPCGPQIVTVTLMVTFTGGPRGGRRAMADPAPLISVIVPLYNVAAHAGRCIASLRAQILTDFEAIIVDDGSTDDSLAVARAAARQDGRFRFVTRANGGLSAARNTGLDAARGAFVAFLDSDDAVTPGWLHRMHGALAATGADWVASAIRFIYPDGGSTLHSAIHGAPALPPAGTPAQRHDLTDWCEVIRHFPSAWNKLYRRGLIGDIRFDEGTYYEDHAFFWRLACRTDHLLHLPEPLYLHLRDRPGQITRDGGERVFEQFAVLDLLRAIQQAGPADRRNGTEAFARIATRLIQERAAVLTDRPRRARFLQASRDFLARHRLHWQPDWDQTLPRGWDLALAGRLAFTLVIPSDGALPALAASLAALEAQSLQDFETLVVLTDPARDAEVAVALAGRPDCRLILCPAPAGEAGVAAARNAGLEAAAGVFVLFLDAGDGLLPGALAAWLDLLLRHAPPGAEGADLGLAPFRMGHARGPWHSGWHDARGQAQPEVAGPCAFGARDALLRHAHPSARVWRAGFLRAAGLRFTPGPLQSWEFLAAAAAAAPAAVVLDQPAAVISEAPQDRRFWRDPVPPARLADAVARIAERLQGQPGLPPGWEGRLFARAIWEKLHFADFAGLRAELDYADAARATARARGLTLQGAADPFLGPRVTALLAAG